MVFMVWNEQFSLKVKCNKKCPKNATNLDLLKTLGYIENFINLKKCGRKMDIPVAYNLTGSKSVN